MCVIESRSSGQGEYDVSVDSCQQGDSCQQPVLQSVASDPDDAESMKVLIPHCSMDSARTVEGLLPPAITREASGVCMMMPPMMSC